MSYMYDLWPTYFEIELRLYFDAMYMHGAPSYQISLKSVQYY